MRQSAKRAQASTAHNTNSKRDVASIRRQVLPILKQHGVKRAALFGSFARGAATKHSDLDLLVEFKGQKGLLDLVALKQALEDAETG